MEVVPNNTLLPGDPRLIEHIVCELKSQGIFDQFRKECIDDVDTKPAYQNLRQRVEGSVTGFLKTQKWRPDMNKNHLREMLRKNIYESGFLETGVERIVDQVVYPKINSVFLPQVEDVVYNFLGLEKPIRTASTTNGPLTINTIDLLPTDLDPISPDSEVMDKSLNKSDKSNDEGDKLDDSKNDEFESPPFEPITEQSVFSAHEDSSNDSHLSGISGLTSHDSNMSSQDSKLNIFSLDVANQDSQLSKVSSNSRLSIITTDSKHASEKMDISDDTDASKSSILGEASNSNLQDAFSKPENAISHFNINQKLANETNPVKMDTNEYQNAEKQDKNEEKTEETEVNMEIDEDSQMSNVEVQQENPGEKKTLEEETKKEEFKKESLEKYMEDLKMDVRMSEDLIKLELAKEFSEEMKKPDENTPKEVEENSSKVDLEDPKKEDSQDSLSKSEMKVDTDLKKDSSDDISKVEMKKTDSKSSEKSERSRRDSDRKHSSRYSESKDKKDDRKSDKDRRDRDRHRSSSSSKDKYGDKSKDSRSRDKDSSKSKDDKDRSKDKESSKSSSKDDKSRSSSSSKHSRDRSSSKSDSKSSNSKERSESRSSKSSKDPKSKDDKAKSEENKTSKSSDDVKKSESGKKSEDSNKKESDLKRSSKSEETKSSKSEDSRSSKSEDTKLSLKSEDNRSSKSEDNRSSKSEDTKLSSKSEETKSSKSEDNKSSKSEDNRSSKSEDNKSSSKSEDTKLSSKSEDSKTSSSSSRSRDRSRCESSKHTSSNSRDRKSSSSKDHKDKKDAKKSIKRDKDDHSSSRDIKPENRRSADRDSNDGSSGIGNSSNSNSSKEKETSSVASSKSKSSENSTDSSHGSNSGDSGQSDNSQASQCLTQNDDITATKTPVKILSETLGVKSEITISPAKLTDSDSDTAQHLKIMKPKIASNIFEARRLMKVRKKMEKLEKKRQQQMEMAQGSKEKEADSLSLEDTDSVDSGCLQIVEQDESKDEAEFENTKTEQPRDCAPTTSVVSKESWDALEAKLSLNVDYDSYIDDNGDSCSSIKAKTRRSSDEEDCLYFLPQTSPKIERYLQKVASLQRDGAELTVVLEDCRKMAPPHMNSEVPTKRARKTNQKYMLDEAELKESMINKKTTVFEGRNNATVKKKLKGKKRKIDGEIDGLYLDNNNKKINNHFDDMSEDFEEEEPCPSANNTSNGSIELNTKIKPPMRSKKAKKTNSVSDTFPLPSSPESDVSANSIEVRNLVQELTAPIRTPRASIQKSQRYSSDDLYKPRPFVSGSSRRQRGLLNNTDKISDDTSAKLRR